MTTSTTNGRRLAIAAGAAATLGALYILLQDAVLSGHWSMKHALMPVVVGITIAVGHLVSTALRDRRWFAAIGFALLFGLGTALTVYASVGRQAETADTKTLAAEEVNSLIAAKKSERERAAQRLIEAEAMVKREMTGQRCGPRCTDWKIRASEVEAKITLLDAELTKLGGPRPVEAEAERMAQVIALFGGDKGKVKAALALLEPFAYALFLELTAIVSFGYGFGHRRRLVARPANDDAPPPARAGDGDPVIDWIRQFEARNGRKPQIPELQQVHRLPKTTAWRRIKAA